ncbi:hypothetical protein I4I73_21570 [Pseudonocardia sp. KRD-184]|uniref:Uncharacterized protein n=1 Tax=Pseudonocardia oceani TaxID=2792013 RepID=A0ABS6UD60_9PSEU|nr:hypothetical protein [Pseudonocardia oceani]MBW0091404.1 hypothetical protein [Pseudonocardia oceani]MBW0098581.1 hypothetical protein [Pseudonocardia oceani]MBW0111089.1 hypothetical protein [Pseudonocardia oceani]MBW0124960.1 hypothetical protein [Pseudonocardia oceani]MBW0129764.1 hypothetical protein [Pseudonocardia oceani]
MPDTEPVCGDESGRWAESHLGAHTTTSSGAVLVLEAAAAVPGARVRFLDGQGHEVDQDVLAPVLAEFLRA